MIGILYEHPNWLDPLFEALDRRSVPYGRVDLNTGVFDIEDVALLPLYVNRLSASSYDRGNQGAVSYGLTFIEHLMAAGARVLNGPSAHLEVNKVDQMRAFRSHGLPVPRTVAFNSTEALANTPGDFPFPAIVKPSQGGAGCLIMKFDTRAELLDSAHLISPPPDGLMLLQEFIAPIDDTTHRVEVLDGEILYTLLSRPGDTFNACPADGDTEAGADFEIGDDPDPELSSQILAMFSSLRLDFGSAEFRIDDGGTPRFFDLNLNSNYHPSLPTGWPEGGWGRYADYLSKELRAVAELSA